MKWLALFAAFLPSASFAEDFDRYRVELLVFQNLNNQKAPREAERLGHFDSAFNPATDELPEFLEVLAEPSEEFAGIWDRMRRSAGYRPLVWLGWEQTTTEFHPPLRLNEQTPRVLVPMESACPALFDPDYQAPEIEIEPATPATLTTSEVETDEESEPLPPVIAETSGGARIPLADFEACPQGSFALQLDGKSQLRLKRFLHLDLDIEFRQQGGVVLPEGVVNPETGNLEIALGALESSEPEPRWNVYTLSQSRQVRTDRMEYFDTPFMSVLARISEVDSSEELNEIEATGNE